MRICSAARQYDYSPIALLYLEAGRLSFWPAESSKRARDFATASIIALSRPIAYLRQPKYSRWIGPPEALWVTHSITPI